MATSTSYEAEKNSSSVIYNDRSHRAARARGDGMSPGQYFASRPGTLKPPMQKAPNPFRLLRQLNTQQWLFFLVGFIGWTWDAFDYFVCLLKPEEKLEKRKVRKGYD